MCRLLIWRYDGCSTVHHTDNYPLPIWQPCPNACPEDYFNKIELVSDSLCPNCMIKGYPPPEWRYGPPQLPHPMSEGASEQATLAFSRAFNDTQYNLLATYRCESQDLQAFVAPLNADDLRWLMNTVEALAEITRLNWGDELTAVRIPLVCRLRQILQHHIVQLITPSLDALDAQDPPPETRKRAGVLLTLVNIEDVPLDKRDCPICRETMGTACEGEEPERPVRLICGHFFGDRCIEATLDFGHRTCPLDRLDLRQLHWNQWLLPGRQSSPPQWRPLRTDWRPVGDIPPLMGYQQRAITRAEEQRPQPATPGWLRMLRGQDVVPISLETRAWLRMLRGDA